MKINNRENDRFKSIPFEERILFLSHCIRSEQKQAIREYAEELGYQVHIVGGGSVVHKIIKRENPKGVIGIACLPELEMAVEKLSLPLQVIELETDGCKDTTVNVEKAKKALAVYEPGT